MGPKRFLFVFWEGGGNVPPQLGLVRRLVSRGHQVRVLTEPSVEDEVVATGASFASFQRAPHRADRSMASDFVRDFDARTPLGAFTAARDRVLLGPARAYAEDTANEIDRFAPDVLAPDWMLTGAAVAGEARHVPTALIVHNIDLVPGPGKPAPGFGFAPAKTALGRARDRIVIAFFVALFNRGLPALNDARRRLGVEPLPHVLDQLRRQERTVCLYSEAFDFPAPRRDPGLRFVGPILDEPAWAKPWQSPWAADDSRALVIVSLSTTFMAQAKLLRRCVEAVASMPVRALVTVGPAMDPAAFPSSENVSIVPSAPHDTVFPQARVVITHAGMGTVTRALAHGVPLVCLPLGRDQGDVAARVAWHGAGIRLSSSTSAPKIRAAVDHVLHQPAFRLAAERMRAAISADVETDQACIELEALADRARLANTQASDDDPLHS